MDAEKFDYNKFDQFIIQLSRALELVSKFMILILMVVMGSLVAINVFTRYILGFSIGWTYELSIHCYIYIVYVGTSLAIKDRTHPKMQVFLNKSKGLTKKILIIFNYSVLLFVLYIFTYYGFIETLNRWGTTARMFNYPLGIIYFAVPFCGITGTIYIIEIFLKARKNIELIEMGNEECL